MARKGFLLCMALCVIALLSLAVVAFAQPAAPLTPEEAAGEVDLLRREPLRQR